MELDGLGLDHLKMRESLSSQDEEVGHITLTVHEKRVWTRHPTQLHENLISSYL